MCPAQRADRIEIHPLVVLSGVLGGILTVYARADRSLRVQITRPREFNKFEAA